MKYSRLTDRTAAWVFCLSLATPWACLAENRAAASGTPLLSHFAAFVQNDGRGQISWISDRPMAAGTVEIERNGRFEEAGRWEEEGLRNHRVVVGTLTPGSHIRIRVKCKLDAEPAWVSDIQELVVPGGASSQGPSRQVDILLSPASPLLAERALLAGVPLARGTCWDASVMRVEDKGGNISSQITTAARWPDGSVRWLLARMLPSARSTGLHLRSGAASPTEESPLKTGEGDEISIDNGLLRWSWNRKQFALFDRVMRGNESVTGTASLGNVRVIDDAGRAWGLGPADRATWEEAGPVRAVLCVEGAFQAEDGTTRFRYRLRYFFTARSPLVQVQLTLTNNADAPEFERIRSLAIRVPLAGEGRLRGQLADGEMVDVAQPGQHEIWQIDADRLRTIVGGKTEVGNGRSAGWAVVERGSEQMAFVVRDFWQLWPKSIALKPDGLHVRLLPEMNVADCQPRDLIDWAVRYCNFDNGQYVIRRGMALRHEFWIRFGQPGDLDGQGGPAAWASSVLSSPYAAVSPEQYCGSGALGPVHSAAADNRPEYEQLVERNVAEVLSLREKTGEYGWMNFGDWHGERTYNWGNNEYDLSWAMALQFARTGREDYFALGEQMARHYAIVDTIHVPLKERMNGRVWAHSVGHVGAESATPTTGPAADTINKWINADKYNPYFFKGLIDAGGHIFQEGNFAYYFLTGDRDLLDAGETACGAQATYSTAKFDFTIERGAGWPLTNAVAAYESTGNPFYLNAARLYVERVLAKQDPVGGGWMLPQPASECDGKAGVGGKAFATGILLYGLMRYDLVEPREDVKHSIVEACRWLVEQTWIEEKSGFRYKTGCDKYRDEANTGTTVAVCLPGLAYGDSLSGDPRFAHVLNQSYLALCANKGSMGKATGMICRQSAFALARLAPSTQP